MEYIIVLDTETTGLPKNMGFNNYYPPNQISYYNTSRMIELAWMVFDKNGNEIKKQSYLIKSTGFNIPTEATNIHHITDEMLNNQGTDLEKVFELFYNDLKDCKTIVAHNKLFDLNIISSECFRLDNNTSQLIIEKLKTCETQCTMELCKQSKVWNKQKLPKLSETYQCLYPNTELPVLHRALQDVETCSKCFFKLMLII